MTTTMSGADISELRTLGGLFASGVSGLQEIASRLSAQVDQTDAWKGKDAEDFRASWTGELRPTLGSASQRMAEASDDLMRNADEQEVASDVTGGFLGEGFPFPRASTPSPSGPVLEGRDVWSELWDAILVVGKFGEELIDAVMDSKAFIDLLRGIEAAGGFVEDMLDKVDEFLSKNKLLGKFGPKLGKLAKAIPIIGSVISIGDGIYNIVNPDHADVRGVLDRVSGVLSVVGGVLMFIPGPPAAVGAGCIALSTVWDVGNFIYDEWDAIKEGTGIIAGHFVEGHKILWNGVTGIWNGAFG